MLKKLFSGIGGFLAHDFVLKIISFILAVILWGVVSVSIYPTIERQVTNIPVKISLEGSYAQANSLEVTSVSDEYVTVAIKGQRGQIGDIKAEDLYADIDATGVMMAKQYTLPLKIDSTSDKVFDVVSITPSNVTVTFDKMVSREIELNALLDGMKLTAGYTAGDPVISPSTVTVTGPQAVVNSITNACVKVNIPNELSSTHEFTSNEIVLYNENAVISNDKGAVTFDRNTFTVQVPVFVHETLPLDVNIINVPENFDVDFFKSRLVFSSDQLDIAAPNEKIREMTSLVIGSINMREVDVGSTFSFSTENFLPAEYSNLSPVDSVTVSCPSEGITKRLIALQARDIQFINKPSNFNFSTTASGLSLFFVGDETQIAELSSADITAQIDLIDFDKQEGEHKMPVDIIISSYDKVWCIGNGSIATPKLIVNAEAVQEEYDQPIE